MEKNTPENLEKGTIKQLINNIGGYWYTNLAGIGHKVGLPDITAIIKGVVIQIEVKSKRGKQSPEQVEFQRAWEYCRGKYFCGTADDFCMYLQREGLLKLK